MRIALLSLAIFPAARAQDIEETWRQGKKRIKEDPFSISGSVGLNSVAYRPYGIAPRRDPLYWVLNANTTVTLFNTVSVPFTAVVTQQDKRYTHGLDQFSQPFNQFGLSPRYRWLTVHAGFRSLEFSEYSLSGAMFLGGGIEIKPKSSLVSGAAFTGRFVKAVPKGGVEGVMVSMPAYERWGSGARIKVGNDRHWGELCLLKFKDDATSIPFDTALDISPQENEIISLSTRQKISGKFSAGGELAFSMFTRNTLQEVKKLEKFTYINQVYEPRASSQFNSATNLTLDYTPGKATINLRYKRIDPDYRSIGAVFLTNDVEEVSLNTSLPLLANRMQFSAGAGLQRNNLDRIQMLTSRRVVGSLNLSYNVNSHVNVSGGYSSFSSNTIPVRDAFTDTIRFVQLTQNGNLSSSYSFGRDDRTQLVSAVLSYQESSGSTQETSAFINATLAYHLSLSKAGWSFGCSAIYNQASQAGFQDNEGLGPGITFGKQLLKNRLRLNATASEQSVYLGKKEISRNLSCGIAGNWTIDRHQSVNADAGYLCRFAIGSQVSEFAELRGSLGYRYNFLIKKKTPPVTP
jgi:hypothetical protein